MFNNFLKRKSFETNSKFIFNFAINKQAKRNNAISESVVDRRTPFLAALLLILPALLILITFTVVPFIYNIKDTFYKVIDTNTGASQFVGFNNLTNLLGQLTFAVGVRNSFIYGLLVLPFSMTVSLLISSLIATVIRKKLRGFLQTVFFLPYITNIVAVSLAFVQIFQVNGQFNQLFRSLGFSANINWLGGTDETAFKSLFVMLINGVWGSLAFNILLFSTAMLSVDKNLYRSASIDGVGGTKQFFTITLPSIRKTISFIMTMGIINGIKVFPLALFENVPDKAFSAGASTIMLYVYKFAQAGQFELSGAASIILFIIGVSYSTVIRSGFRILTLVSLNKGESDVWNKIKNSSEISEHKAKTQARFSYSTSTW
ncbi:carbohydrate ABC transporter permease [Mycoplasma sp. HS2188]|uniref:carbohydrate ABC transporter permease n=1 Tax=Mycoplasma sp. HS2188 TaxID=2976765 RepID=UPI0021AA185B|nr:sugar ABC transporter permease [Mycoplasma sp. HS2188]MCT4469949.1 sugar ABC transporter permease [Mycoplasma sp. HS2188]